MSLHAHDLLHGGEQRGKDLLEGGEQKGPGLLTPASHRAAGAAEPYDLLKGGEQRGSVLLKGGELKAPELLTSAPSLAAGAASIRFDALKEDATKRKPLILVSLLLAAFAINLDTTIVNVALPTLVRQLHASNSELQWVVDAFSLVFAASVLAAGSFSDRFGRKGMLLAGLSVFGLASIAGGFTTSPGQLIAARAVMGLGAAMVFPATLSLLTNVFTERRDRARAIGLWGATTGAAIALGPIVGGWLLEQFTWTSIFFAMAPVAGVAAALVARHVPTSRDAHAPRTDRGGFALSTMAMAALTYTIIEAPSHGWSSPWTLGGFVLTALAFATFVAWELRSDAPMLDLSLFSNPRFTAASASVAISFFALSGFIFLVAQYFQFMKSYGPLSTGVRLLPVATFVAISSIVGAKLAVRFGTKLIVAAGLLAMAAFYAWASTTTATTAYLTIAIQMVVLGVGMGLTSAPATEAIMGVVPKAKAGVGSAVNDATRLLGGTLGVAVIGSVYASLYASRLAAMLPTGEPAALSRAAHSSVGAAFAVSNSLRQSGHATLAGNVHDAANSAFFHGFATADLVTAGIAAAGAVMALAFLPAHATTRAERRQEPTHLDSAANDPGTRERVKMMFERLASFMHRNSRRVLIVAVVGVAIAGTFGIGVTKRLSPYGATDPSTQSVQATNRYQAAAGRQIDPGVIALVKIGDVHSAGAERRVRQVEAELRSSRDVAAVSAYYDSHNPAMLARDGRSTYVVAYFQPKSDSRIGDDASRLESEFASQHDVRLGGPAIASEQANTQVRHDLAHAELLAFPIIFLLSLLFFRSLVAALVPPLLGGLAILATFFALRVVSSFSDLSVFALNLVIGLGLGLAIDYSLFMVSRYREESALDGFGVDALRRTLATAGRTIAFSSLTVAAALASLAIFPQQFLYSMGIAGALVALIAATLALLVLPAMLAALGPRVNALAPSRLQRAADRDARAAEAGFWYRLSQFVTRRPRTIAVLSAAALIALGTPFLSIRFLPVDASVLPASTSAHLVDQALRTTFPPGRTSPLEVVVGAPAGSPKLRAFAHRIRGLPDVSAVAPAQPAGPHLSLLDVAPSAPTYSAATKELVHTVRALPAPLYVGVAGQTAAFVDLEHSLGARLPLVLAAVIASTLIALFLMTGSLVLGVKAVLMNALTLSAVFGILVLIFQHGHLQGLLSYQSNAALDATQPILLFAIGFALATDYAVFLLSRIKEARDSGIPNSQAVAVGLERTGRIVTAAALLFAVAIGAFATSKLVFIKELGVGTALVVLIDATVIRALLVPSLMVLLGKWNWWAPKPLRLRHTRTTASQTPDHRQPAGGVQRGPT